MIPGIIGQSKCAIPTFCVKEREGERERSEGGREREEGTEEEKGGRRGGEGEIEIILNLNTNELNKNARSEVQVFSAQGSLLALCCTESLLA